MPQDFPYDVFLSHSSKDKTVVRGVATRLRQDGLKVWRVVPQCRREGGFDEWVLKPGDRIPAKIDPPSPGSSGAIEGGLERSRVLAGSAEAAVRRRKAGSYWTGSLPFRDPLNKKRRFIPLRLDDSPIKGSLAQLFSTNLGAKNII